MQRIKVKWNQILPFPERPHLIPLDFGESDFNEGDYVQGSCILQKGDRPLNFTWVFNDIVLQSGDGVRMDYIGKSSILTIDPVRGVHQGIYTCIASNPAGEEQVSATLVVNGTVVHLIYCRRVWSFTYYVTAKYFQSVTGLNDCIRMGVWRAFCLRSPYSEPWECYAGAQNFGDSLVVDHVSNGVLSWICSSPCSSWIAVFFGLCKLCSDFQHHKMRFKIESLGKYLIATSDMMKVKGMTFIYVLINIISFSKKYSVCRYDSLLYTLIKSALQLQKKIMTLILICYKGGKARCF